MDDTYNTRAIIINRQNFKEKDVKITIFSEDKGKMNLIARGAKKPQSKLAGHIEPLTLTNLMIACGKQNDYVATSQGCNFFSGIKNNLGKLSSTGKVLNLINRYSREEDDSSREIFLLLESYFNTLEKKDILDTELFSGFFILKYLQISGFEPSLHNCCDCNGAVKPNNNFFDFKNSSTLCGTCRPNIHDIRNRDVFIISNECIKVLKFILNNDFNLLSNLKISEKLTKELKNNIDLLLKFNL